jgi:Flp pilus assembly protein TadD
MDKALKELGTALQDYPGESLLWYEIGRIHARQKHLAQAIVELTKATELDPELAEAYNELGIVLAEGAAAAAAEAAFRNSLRIAPYDPGVASNLQMLNASRGGSAK